MEPGDEFLYLQAAFIQQANRAQTLFLKLMCTGSSPAAAARAAKEWARAAAAIYSLRGQLEFRRESVVAKYMAMLAGAWARTEVGSADREFIAGEIAGCEFVVAG